MAKLLLNADGKVLMDKGKVLKSPGKQESESVAYYKAMRNKNYPYLPLPSEMTEEDDVIYMLYDARGHMCCPAFKITFTSVIITVQKYMNKTLVSEYEDTDIVSNTNKYMQFSEDDDDYSTFNYIVIKIQGIITNLQYAIVPKFNEQSYNVTGGSDRLISNDLIEVSGNCNNCNITKASASGYKLSLRYFSFKTNKEISAQGCFEYHYDLLCIPELDVIFKYHQSLFMYCEKLVLIGLLKPQNVTNANSMFAYCKSLIRVPDNINFDNCTTLQSTFNTCNCLIEIPIINAENVSILMYAFSDCTLLKKIPIKNAIKVTNISYAFQDCPNIEEIPDLNFPNTITSFSSAIYRNVRLRKIELKNIYYPMYLTDCLFLSHDELVKILNNLATVETTQKLTLGSTLLAKLTDEEKLIATNKGWTLA